MKLHRTTSGPAVGLDLDAGAITAAEVEAPAGVQAPVVTRAVSAPLAPGAISGGEIADADAVAEALRELFDAHRLPRRVRIGIAAPRIAVRTLLLPPIADADALSGAVRFQAQDAMPIPLEQAVLDHRALGELDTPEGRRMRVLAVAADREMVTRVVEVVRRARLRPVGVDLSAFALVRALAHRGAHTGATLYVNAGALTTLALAEGTTCTLTRVSSGGLEATAGRLAQRAQLTVEHARQWLGHVGLSRPVDEIEGEERIVTATRAELETNVAQMADDVRALLEYHGLQAGGAPAARVVLAGPGAALDGLAQALDARTVLPVEVGAAAVASSDALGPIAPSAAAVATGLAVEEVAHFAPAGVEEALAA